MAEGRSREELERATVRVPPDVVRRAFPSETVVLNLDTERYYGLNETAGEMLEALARHGRVRPAAEDVAERYGKPVEEVQDDLAGLCLDLERRGLIELDFS
jgi:hypothetical protein